MAGENWYLQSLKSGVDPTHEANTSRYVHEALRYCLGWPFESILPQESKRGYIDYSLFLPKATDDIHVEVKRFREPLKDNMISKYIVCPGKQSDFRVGVLTNFSEWQVFVAGPLVTEMTGKPLHLVRLITIESRSDLENLRLLIGYRTNSDLRELRAAIGESDSPQMIFHLLKTDSSVIGAIRAELSDIRDRLGHDIPIPQRDAISGYVSDLINGQWSGNCPFSIAKFRQALCSKSVAEAIDNRLIEVFDSRTQIKRIRNEVKTWIQVLESDNEEVI